MFVSETYAIIDALYSHPEVYTETPTSTTNTFHMSLMDSNLSLNLPSAFELTFKLQSNKASTSRFLLIPTSQKNKTSNPYYSLGVQQTTTVYIPVHINTSVSGVGSDTSYSNPTQYHEWKIIVNGSSVSWTFDGSDTRTATLGFSITEHIPYLFAFTYYQGGTMSVKDIVIKPL